jgi:hypothetical protein
VRIKFQIEQRINSSEFYSRGENMRKIYMVSISMLLFSILLGGCAGDSSSKEAIRSLVSSVDMDPVYLGGDKEAPLEKIKKTVADHDEIYDVAVVQRARKYWLPIK